MEGNKYYLKFNKPAQISIDIISRCLKMDAEFVSYMVQTYGRDLIRQLSDPEFNGPYNRLGDRVSSLNELLMGNNKFIALSTDELKLYLEVMPNDKVVTSYINKLIENPVNDRSSGKDSVLKEILFDPFSRCSKQTGLSSETIYKMACESEYEKNKHVFTDFLSMLDVKYQIYSILQLFVVWTEGDVGEEQMKIYKKVYSKGLLRQIRMELKIRDELAIGKVGRIDRIIYNLFNGDTLKDINSVIRPEYLNTLFRMSKQHTNRINPHKESIKLIENYERHVACLKKNDNNKYKNKVIKRNIAKEHLKKSLKKDSESELSPSYDGKNI